MRTSLVPAEGATNFSRVLWRDGGHEIHSQRTQYTVPVPAAMVHDGSTNDRKIFRIGEYPGIPGIAHHDSASQRVVHISPQRIPVCLNLSRSAECLQFLEATSLSPFRRDNHVGREITGMLQSEDPEDILAGIFIKLTASHSLQYPLQSDEIKAAVHELSAGPEISLHSSGNEGLRRIGSILAEFFDVFIYIDIWRESRRMGHEVADRYVHGFSRRRVYPRLKSRNITTYVVGETHITSFNELHERKGSSYAFAD